MSTFKTDNRATTMINLILSVICSAESLVQVKHIFAIVTIAMFGNIMDYVNGSELILFSVQYFSLAEETIKNVGLLFQYFAWFGAGAAGFIASINGILQIRRTLRKSNKNVQAK